LYAALQKWIGYADVKSAPVHFYVQRKYSIYVDGTESMIRFEIERVNIGNAMDLRTGIFTSPRPGTYFFSFSGIGEHSHLHKEPVSMYIGLLLNGRIIGSDFTEETTSYYHSVKRGPLSIQSTLKLNEGDEVWLRIYRSQGYIYLLEDGDKHFSHFTGFMLEEEIVASL
jgi:hypothetical protein